MTIAQIINIWPIAQYLAANEIQNRRNNSGAVDVNLPTKIYSIGTAVQRIYDSDPTDDTLPATARYLYALCGKYGLQASVVTEEAGTVSPVTPVTLPQPIDWIVAATASATAVLADGEGSVMLDGTKYAGLAWLQSHVYKKQFPAVHYRPRRWFSLLRMEQVNRLV